MAWAQNYTPRETGAKTRTDRLVGSISVNGDAYTLPEGTRCSYTDATEEKTFTVWAGETITLGMAQTKGTWMNAYVYIDQDQNGFTAGIGSDGYTPTGDLVSYSFYNNGASTDTEGYNSVGNSITGGNRSTLSLPSIVAPTTLGTYRIRFKYDWCNIDPAGGEGKYWNNTFTGHGGEIIDATLKVVYPFEYVESGKPTKWYNVALHPQSKYYISVNADGQATATQSLDGTMNSIWGFVGTPAEGFKLVNAAGKELVFGSPATVADANGTVFTVVRSPHGGSSFALQAPNSNQCLNPQNGLVKSWTLDQGCTVLLQEVNPVAQIGDDTYFTFADALNAAQAGDEIKLLADTDASVILPVGVKLNNNGFQATKVKETVATIGETRYATFAEALTAAAAMTGDVTVEIYGTVTLNGPLTGSYTSINFVGKAENAEMYLDVQGYVTATGKKVSFTDLKLSKSEGGFMANAGFMNVAFGIYDVEEVTYTNCTFENGACASSGKVTFNGCTFKKSWVNYGLWAYGDVDVTVDNCTFADYRGIKMYAEGGADASVAKANLTVKNTDFSAVDNKPAIVLTYGESVVLEGNTYSSTGTFELDLDGNPNGVAVTSDVAPVCVNDKGACGVLVDGKIYTTVAQAAEVATETSTVTLLHSSNETVEFPMGTTIELNGFTADYVTTAQPFAEYVVLPQDITVNNYKAKFGDNTVTDGVNYYATLQAAVEAIAKNAGVARQAGAVLYCKPGADVGALQHAPVVSTLTIYGNDANVTGGAERDFDLGNSDPSGGKDITADMTLTVKHLNGCGAWGTKATEHTVNLVFENCANMGKVFIYGSTGTLNITMTDCAFEGVIKEAVYSNADGAITLNNVAFSNLNKAINLNHKAAGTQTVTINGCTFTNCGADVAADQIPVRVLSSVEGGKSVLNVSNTTFTGTPEGGADILLDYGVGDSELNIASTGANVSVETKKDVATTTTVTPQPEKQTFTNAAPVAEVNGVEYMTFAEAAAAVQTGGEIKLLANIDGDITVPANVTLNGNGFAISGGITAAGEIIFAGVTKAASFNVENTNTVVNIPAGASLQLTGTGRMVIGHGCTFNITGTIEDAKTADKATLTPSLVMPGASFTGAGVTFNVTNAYISAPSSYCSSSKSASGTFDFNINNSIWENAGKLAFESQSTAATVNFDLVSSVLNTGSHLVFGVSRGEVVIDDSNVNVGKSNQIENQSTMTIKNGSVVNGAVATSSNAINPGTIIVENATYAVTGEFSGSDLGTGTLIIKKGATVSAGSITKADITIDATDMVAGDVVNLTADLAKLIGTLSVINNDKLEAKIVDGKIVLANLVAKIGTTSYDNLLDALKAAQDGEIVVMYQDVELYTRLIFSLYTNGKKVTLDGNGHKLFASSTNWGTGNGKHLINVNCDNVTLKNLVLDCNNIAEGANIYMAQNIVFDNVSIINKKGWNADLTVNGSTLAVENQLSASYVDVSLGKGVTTPLGIVANEGAVLDTKTLQIASAAYPNTNLDKALSTDGTSYYSLKKVDANGNLAGYSNSLSRLSNNYGYVLLEDMTVNSNVTLLNAGNNGKLNTNGHTLTVADGKALTVNGNLAISGEGTIDGAIMLGNTAASVSGAEGLTIKSTLEGAEVVYKDGQYVVAVYVAKIGEQKYATLAEAFAAADGATIVMIDNVETTEGVSVANGKTVTLDLNGKTITGTDNSTGSYALITNQGNLTITGEGAIKLTATNNRGWNAYSSVISNTVGGKLTVEKGTIEHLGGTDMAYGIDNLTNGKGTYAETIINGGTVKSTYRAVRQFLNGVEAQNILTVNAGTIEGANKSIWMQDPSKSANTGTLTVSAGASLKGDVYLFVTAGSTEWPVEVSIAAAALKDGATVLTGNIPAQYVVKNDNGTWGKSSAVASVDGVGYETLAAAIAAASEDATVTMVADVVLDKTVKVEGKAFTLDLNGKTVSGTCNAGQSSLVYVENNAALTVKDDSEAKTGKLTYAAGSSNVGWTVDVKGTLTLESGTIELTGSWSIGYAVDVRPNSWGTEYKNATKFTMNGGKLVSSDGAVRVASSSAAGHKAVAASFVMNGGVIDAAWDGVFVQQSDAIYDVLNFTINGGTIESDLNPVRVYGPAPTGYVTDTECMTINFNGGTMDYTGSETYEWVIEGILRVGGGSSIETITENGTIVATAEFANANTLPDGYVWEENAEGDYVAVELPKVAKVGNVEYTSLADAIAAADSATVTVLTDIALTETVTIPAGKTITLDLDGKTISQEKACTASYEMINNKGNLTITGNGKLSFKDTSEGDPSFGWGSYTVRNEGTLVVENGTIEHLGEQSAHCIQAIFQYSGSTTINGGTISTPNYRSVRLWKGDMTINGGTFDGQVWVQAVDNSAKLTVNGGTFEPNGGDSSSVFVSNSTYKVDFAVTNGTFNGKIGCSNVSKLAGAITGGQFTEAAKNATNADLIANYYYFGDTVDANGYYNVEKDPNYIPKLVIDDAEGKDFDNDSEKIVGTLTYKRTLVADAWNPLYVPFELPMSELIENYDLAYYNDVHAFDDDKDGTYERTTIELIKITDGNAVLKANYPLIIRPKSADPDVLNLELVLTEDVALSKAVENKITMKSASHDFEIMGTYSKRESLVYTETVTQYALGREDGTGLPKWITTTGSLNPYRLILTVTSRGNVDLPFQSIGMRVIGDDSLTDIEGVEFNTNGEELIFDLQGRRVLEPKKGGIYIINGKKVYFK